MYLVRGSKACVVRFSRYVCLGGVGFIGKSFVLGVLIICVSSVLSMWVDGNGWR